MIKVRLGDICEISIGRTPARANSEYWGAGTPWLSIADMNQGRRLVATREQITAKALHEAKCKVVQTGTVVLSFKLSIGKVGIVRIPMATNEAIAALTPRDPEQTISEYLAFALASMKLAAGANRAAMGGTLNKKSLAEIRIPLPSVEEQHRVVAMLDKADALRAKRREAIAHLDVLNQSIFHDMFGDPVSNERKWDVCDMATLLEKIDSGSSPVCADRPADVDECGLLKLGAVTSGDWMPFENKAFKETAPDPRHEVQLGDVLFSRKNTPNLVAAVVRVDELPRRLYMPDLIFRLRLKDSAPLAPEYLTGLLQFPSQKRQIQRLASGSAQSMVNISKEKLRRTSVVVPPLDLQREFVRRVARVAAIKAKHRAQLTEMDKLFLSLQDRAFKGEL